MICNQISSASGMETWLIFPYMFTYAILREYCRNFENVFKPFVIVLPSCWINV
jgi:hypothetical protein